MYGNSSTSEIKMPQANERSIILDASAILALLNSEPGAAEVQAVVTDSAVSTVNLAEVAGKLADHGMTDSTIERALRIGFDTLAFGPDELKLMPILRRSTVKYGLSLGDRCCLATAMARKRPVMTADRAWTKVNIPGLAINVIGARQ